MDDETRALSGSPVFQRLIAQARASKGLGSLSTEEFARRHGITDEERAAVRARLLAQSDSPTIREVL